MILLILLAWCFIGAFAGGVVLELHDKAMDTVWVMLMAIFAPVTVIYIAGYLSMRLGQKVVKVIREL